MAQRKRLVVVGNGMAGMRTVEELLALAPEQYQITVIGEEPHGNYNRIMLSPVLSGEKRPEEIFLHTKDWYRDNDIELLAGHKVTDIDRVKRELHTDQGQVVSYDRLLLATGSRPTIPPLDGVKHRQVLTFRTLNDIERITAACQPGTKVAVIGGGLLGLEAAYGLTRYPVEVTVVNRSDRIMNRQLDQTAADLLQAELEQRGIQFAMRARSRRIASKNAYELSQLEFEQGEPLPVDLLVLAVGIQPNIELARQAGLHTEAGIVVSDTLQTYDPSIYAVGECVQHRGQVFGLVAPLYDQAKVCANHLAGMGIAHYVTAPLATRLKVSGINLFSAGQFEQEEGDEAIVLQDHQAGTYKKLVVRDNRLVGCVLYGDTRDGNWYMDWINSNQSIAGIRANIAFGQAYCDSSDDNSDDDASNSTSNVA